MTHRFTRRALRQIDEIADTIHSEDRRAAIRFLRRVETVAALAGRHPLIGRPTDLQDVRVFRVAPFPYLMFYQPARNGPGIEILRLRHTALSQNWKEGR